MDLQNFVKQRFGDGDPALLDYQLRASGAIEARYSSHDFLGNPNVLTWLLGRAPTTFEQFVQHEYAAFQSLYRRHRPDKSPYLLLGEIVTDAGFRRFAHAQAERLAEVGQAPVYMYEWNWPTPAFGGIFGAAHATDVPAIFGNYHDPLLGAGDADAIQLSEQLSGALIAFARNGEPSHDAAPWPAFDCARRATFVLNRKSSVLYDPDAELRAFWANMPMPASVFG